MGRRFTARMGVGLENLYRDALDARAEVKSIPHQDAATIMAAALLYDISFAAWVLRTTPTTLTRTERRRIAANSNSGG
jgi:hypothetical protein